MSGLKRESIVGPLLENAARFPAEGAGPDIVQGLLQQEKQVLKSTTAAQQSAKSHDGGDEKQHCGRLSG